MIRCATSSDGKNFTRPHDIAFIAPKISCRVGFTFHPPEGFGLLLLIRHSKTTDRRCRNVCDSVFLSALVGFLSCRAKTTLPLSPTPAVRAFCFAGVFVREACLYTLRKTTNGDGASVLRSTFVLWGFLSIGLPDGVTGLGLKFRTASTFRIAVRAVRRIVSIQPSATR